LDGHADCKFSCEPLKTKKLGGLCPICGKKLLVGVLNRVDELADRKYGFIPSSTIPFKSVIPLEEIIAETFDVGTQSKRVLEVYEKMTKSEIRIKNQELRKTNEFEILLDLSEEQITQISSREIAEAVMRVREGKVRVEGGYDGVFGKIHIFSDEERGKLLRKPKQMGLF
jgi:PHP family Zn ribbon phosphoesterase